MNNLPYAILGRTNFKITRLGYGAAHQRPMTLKQADEILNSVLDSGINFIDTSPDYGNSEDLIGKFIIILKKIRNKLIVRNMKLSYDRYESLLQIFPPFFGRD